MSKSKPPHPSKKNEVSIVRSLAAEYMTFAAADGKGYNTKYYKLAAIIAVGYKVNSERAVQFRKWATTIIESFTLKGYAMDDERLKNDGSVLTKRYFEEQLQRIREIRISERTFKLTLNFWRIRSRTASRVHNAKSKPYCIVGWGFQGGGSTEDHRHLRYVDWLQRYGAGHQAFFCHRAKQAALERSRPDGGRSHLPPCRCWQRQ